MTFLKNKFNKPFFYYNKFVGGGLFSSFPRKDYNLFWMGKLQSVLTICVDV